MATGQVRDQRACVQLGETVTTTTRDAALLSMLIGGVAAMVTAVVVSWTGEAGIWALLIAGGLSFILAVILGGPGSERT